MLPLHNEALYRCYSLHEVEVYSRPRAVLTIKNAVQQLHNIVLVRILLPLALRRPKEVTRTEHKVELAMLRVYSLNFGKQFSNGSCSRPYCESNVKTR